MGVSSKLLTSNRWVFALLLIGFVGCGGGGGPGDIDVDIPDVIPDGFSFAALETTDLSSPIESLPATITGIDSASPVIIENGEYRINQGNYVTTPGVVNDGDDITVRVTSAATAGQSVTARLTVGGIGANFVVTTIAQQTILTRLSNASCLAPDSPGNAQSDLVLQEVFPDLPSLPGLLGLYQAPGDDSRWYAMLQSGLVYWFDNDPAADNLNLFIDLSAQVLNDGEQGLLGMAFDPAYASNNRVFFSYVNNNQASIISRIDANSIPLDPADEVVYLSLQQPAGNHNGGHIAFGPDGYLYIGFGDGGGANDTFDHGQNTNSLHAAILRYDVSGDQFVVPNDNPFVGDPDVIDPIFAYGLRNPWRWSFDSQNGDLWLGDVGQNRIEEIDIVTAGSNLGWPIMEGSECFQSNSCDMTGLTLPVSEYSHQDGDCSVTGGYVYRGQSVDALQGKYLYGDFCTGRIRSVTPEANQTYNTEVLLLAGFNIGSFAQGNNGEVYVLNFFGGAGGGVMQFVDQGAGGSENIPQNLSDTGCFASTSAKTLSQGVVGYAPLSQLWSDGAQKTRAFAIPDTSDIDLLADGDFDFPENTVLIKNFIQNGDYLETRLFMRHLSGWAGYSYRWLPDQSDAALVAGSQVEIVDGGTYQHIIPTRGQCFECHTSAANASLGLEASQLNQDFTYANGNTGNQLAALAEAGYLSMAPDVNQVSALVAIDDSNAAIDQRARSYLHSNCSGCHRPGGPGAQLDLRIQSALAQTNTCDVMPQNGDLGINGARIIDPGDAGNSVLLARMQSLQADTRMPPLATDVVDQAAVDVVTQWINGLGGCN